MDLIKGFMRLLRVNTKRLLLYIPATLIGSIILLVICSFGGYLLSSTIDTSEKSTKINLAYYLPEDTYIDANAYGVDIISGITSMSEKINLIPVDTIEGGHRMLETHEALLFIVVPVNFIESILNGTNLSLEIFTQNFTSIDVFIVNQTLQAFGRYLGVAQSAVYSGLDVLRKHNIDEDIVIKTRDAINFTFMEKVFARTSYTDKVEVSSAGSYTLFEHYLGAAITVSLLFVGFMLMPMIVQRIPKINRLQLYLCNILTTAASLYIVAALCIVVVGTYTKSFHLMGLLKIIPGVLIISIIICTMALLCKTIFAGNLTLLFFTIFIAYVGGLIIPESFLPQIINTISTFLPGEYILNIVCSSLFI